MKIGIYGGGFKPFTTGHFSKLALASSQNDFVILFYGVAERKKGEAGYHYTREIANKIFEITKYAIEREFPQVIVVKGTPTPLAMTFEAIQQFAGTLSIGKFFNWSDIGLNPSQQRGDELIVYAGPGDIDIFISYVGDPIKEQKYYGSSYQDGTLKFESGLRGDSDDIVVNAVEEYMRGLSREEITNRARVRGTEVRNAISSRNRESIKRFLPPIYDELEKEQIIDTLLGGLTENLLRTMIKTMITEQK